MSGGRAWGSTLRSGAMYESKWSERSITDSAQRILAQIRPRAGDRGMHVADHEAIVMLALWSVLLWERKVGRVALEYLGVDHYSLLRDLEPLLDQKAGENPVAVRQGVPVLVKSGEPYRGWDLDGLLEPLLRQAEQEARALGHDWVGSEHLLLAITQLADPTLAAVLQKHGVAHDWLQEAVVEVLALRHRQTGD